MTTHEFWQTTPFSYLITYSLNRGAKWEALCMAAKHQFAALRKELLTADAAQLPAMRDNLSSLERNRDLDLLPLTESSGAYHITASPIARIAAESPAAAQLAAILAIPVQQQLHWMCAPVYRDALAFYDSQDNLCAVLNICFGCDRMITHELQEISADTAAYKALKQYLIELGHVIEEK
ncbi:hypothetical protein MUN81_10625 [Hymenobacter sp. 5317J-9]|uniref:hypothetical protein n=1 Tax=Hymenobacter sp. 5317J-9 TaxID=2932250 RepID=UPI001FD69209|nr:hypothetical protein [Hymenobacter sp. 5317J-9]UOQ99933.1 hypothetical protein MUN81_10625 [Hymenobacter sp. 5317J-9]